jgi:hypothetical protein
MDKKIVVDTRILARILNETHDYILGFIDVLNCNTGFLLANAVPYSNDHPDDWGYGLTLDMLDVILEKYDNEGDE